MWQDFTIMMVQWGFVLFLVPSVLHASHKPPLLTSLLTAIGVFIITGTLLTLELWLSALSAAAVGTMWSILAYQRYRLNKTKS